MVVLKSLIGEILSTDRHGLERRPQSLTLGRRKPGWGRFGGDLFRPTLLFLPTDQTRVREDRGRRASRGATSLGDTSGPTARSIRRISEPEFRPKATPGGDLPPSALLSAVEPCTPVIVVRPCPHHRTPDEQRHDAHGQHERTDPEAWQSHWHSPAMKPDSPRTPVDTTQARSDPGPAVRTRAGRSGARTSPAGPGTKSTTCVALRKRLAVPGTSSVLHGRSSFAAVAAATPAAWPAIIHTLSSR